MRSSPEGSGLAAHLQLFRGLGVDPIEVFRNTPGKNAADIAPCDRHDRHHDRTEPWPQRSTSYTLTFWVGNVDNPGNGFGTTSTVNVNFGGLNGTLLDSVTNSLTNSTTQTWEMFTTSFTASGSTTTIDFLNGDPANDNTNGLDNVSVNATSAVPEPSSLALLGSALGVLAFWLWPRKRTYRG